jgi:uncharacterized protein (TIGR02453 family)
MITKQTLKFLKDLKANNNKVWFDANRAAYDLAKENYLGFIDAIIVELSKIDPAIAAAELTAKKCVTRINRDVRFSTNKNPYKTNFGAMINKDGKKGMGSGYYVHLEDEACFVAGGTYMPLPPQLAKIRQEIDYNFKEFDKIVTNKIFHTSTDKGLESYEQLVRPPKGYTEDNQALAYLKLKGFIATKSITINEIQSTDGIKVAKSAFKAIKPLVDFINRAIDSE